MQQRLLLIIGILNLLAVSSISIILSTRDERVVYIDSARLLNNYKGMEAARAAYQIKTNSWKANVDTLASEVQKLIFKYERESKSMNAKEQSLSQELIRTKQRQYTDYQQALTTQAQQEEAKLTGDVVTQVNAYLKKYGKEKGYKIILAATEYGNLAYADQALDITDEVLVRINADYIGK
jgi:outer membrane protein